MTHYSYNRSEPKAGCVASHSGFNRAMITPSLQNFKLQTFNPSRIQKNVNLRISKTKIRIRIEASSSSTSSWFSWLRPIDLIATTLSNQQQQQKDDGGGGDIIQSNKVSIENKAITSEKFTGQTLNVSRPIISIAGGGRYFFWYLGVMKYMLEFFDLSQCTLIGASAGGLVAVLSACNVNLDRAVREAYRLSVENDIWSRPSGLAGIWGGLIRQWLDELLPSDAEERCSGRVKLVVTEALTLRIRYIDEFVDRDDVLDAAMTSAHIPFFLDGNATRQYRGGRYLDGSLWDFVTGSNSELITCSGQAAVIDYFFDETLEFNRFDFVALTSYEEVKQLVRKGYEYAERVDAAGGFEEKLGAVRKGVLRTALEFPVRLFNKAMADVLSLS